MSVAVFACGGVIIDNMVSADGVLARDLVGGNAVYAAVGASHWLGRAGICARVPRNYPAHARQALASLSLDLAGIATEPVDVLRSEWFFHRADGSRADHLYASADQADAFGMMGERVPADRARRFQALLETQTGIGGDFKAFRASHPVTEAQVPEPYWQARGVHLGPNLPEAQLTLARAARRRGLMVTCDPGFHAVTFSADQLDELLDLADAFLPSEKELAVLCPGMEAEAALRWLAARARSIVGVKRGAQGGLLLRKGESEPIHVPVVPVTALDPTGAGDSFCGGLLAGLVLGDDLVHAGLRGAVSASLAIECAGAIQPPGRGDEAVRRLRTASSQLPRRI